MYGAWRRGCTSWPATPPQSRRKLDDNADTADLSASIVEKKGLNLMRKIIVLAAAAAALMVSACNTVAGMGRDVQSAGKAVTGTANDAKR
jgi:predicted small secreted protein